MFILPYVSSLYALISNGFGPLGLDRLGLNLVETRWHEGR